MRLVILILIGTLIGVLWWTNPGEEQFESFLVEEVRQLAADGGAQAAGVAGGAMGFLTERLGRAAGDALGRAAASRASEMAERDNYAVASMYTLDLNGRATGGEWKFLGVAGQFFPISKPDNIETLVRDMITR